MTSETSIPSREAIDQCTRDLYKPMALRAALQLDLFSALAESALTGKELADALGVGQHRLEKLLYQLVLSEFLQFEDDLFSNSAVSDHYLVKGRPDYTGGIHQSWTNQWNTLLKTADGIRLDKPQMKVDFDAMSSDQLQSFLRGLQGTTMASGRALASKFDFSKARKVLDVGGGSGGLSIALCQANPGMTATILELPKVASITQEFVAEANLQERINVQTADVVGQPLEGDFDVAVARAFFQVLHEENARTAMQHVAAGVAEGGYLHIIGFVSDDSRLGPETAIGMNVVFINQYDDGGVYTEGQYREWMNDAGFSGVTCQPFVAGNSLISARKT